MLNRGIDSKKIVKSAIYSLVMCSLISSLAHAQDYRVCGLEQEELQTNEKTTNPYEVQDKDRVANVGELTAFAGLGMAVISLAIVKDAKQPLAAQKFSRELYQDYINRSNTVKSLYEQQAKYKNELAELQKALDEGKVTKDTKIGTLKVKEKISGLNALRIVADAEIESTQRQKRASLNRILRYGRLRPLSDEHAKSVLETYAAREQRAQEKFNATKAKAKIAVGTGLAFMLGGAILYVQSDAIAESYNNYLSGKATQAEMEKNYEQVLDCALPSLLKAFTFEELLQ